MTITSVKHDRAWFENELARECFRAKREMPKLGTAACPTPWDVRHADLDLLLTQWQATD